MKILVKLLFLSILFYSCKTSNKVITNSDDLLVSMQKTECRGKCPVYSISIYRDGRITYSGIKNVERIGSHSKQLSKVEVRKIEKAFSKSNFFDYDDEYTNKITDLPTTYISFTMDNKTKRIRDYHGAPSELKILEEMISNIAMNSNGWKQEYSIAK